MINLLSDTQTRPTPAMRRAIADARVGDEQGFEDPTTNELQERVAELLGHEAALFLPSGTMCNGIGFRLHVRPGGDAVILDRTSHPVVAEAGGPAAISGATLSQLDGEGGIFTAAQVEAALAPPTPEPVRAALAPGLDRADHQPRWGPRVAARARARVARPRGDPRPAHPPRRRAADERRGRLRRARSRVGARLRHRVDRLLQGPGRAGGGGARGLGRADRGGLALQADVGRRAAPVGRRSPRRRSTPWTTTSSAWPRTTPTRALLAEGLAELPGVAIDPAAVETNIVLFEVAAGAAPFCAALADEGVRMGPFGATRVRAVTHLDVDRPDIETALAAARRALESPVGSV